MSEPADRVDYLDGWRGTAIGALLAGHFVPGFGLAPRYGINLARLGVELFFVLSGLLMGNLLFVKKVRIRDFYRRRVSRIFPALYWYLLVITVVLALRSGVHAGKTIAAVFLLYFNYYAAANNLQVPQQYQHIWSLCIEEHCYILLSLIAVASRRWRVSDKTLIVACVLVSWGFAATYTSLGWDYYHLFWRTEARLGAVFTSAALVCYLRDGGRPLVRGGWVAVPLAVGLTLQANAVPDLVKYTLGSTLLAITVTHLRFAVPALIRPYRARWLMLLGVLSYSIYLWQQPFMVLSQRLPNALCLVGAMVLGAASFYLLEKPARRWINAHWVG